MRAFFVCFFWPHPAPSPLPLSSPTAEVKDVLVADAKNKLAELQKQV